MKRQRAVTGDELVEARPTAIILVVIVMDTYQDPSYYYNPDTSKEELLDGAELFSPEAGIFEQTDDTDWPEPINGWIEIDSDKVGRLTSEQWCKVIHRYL